MTEQEMKALLEKSQKTIAEIREIAEKKDASLGEVKERTEKLEKSLADFDKANQEITTKFAESEKEKMEMKGKLEILEKTLSRPGLSKTDATEKTEEVKAFEKFIVKGKESLTPEERKYIRTDNNVDGGFLAPSEFIPEILKKITEISPMRSLCRIIKTSQGTVEIPYEEDIISGYWVGEGMSGTPSKPKYGDIKIPTHKMMAICRISTESLGDSAFNMETEINSNISRTFAKMEGAGVLSGNGINKPTGILNSTKVQSKNSGVATSYTADNLIEMCGMVKNGYSPMFGINRSELAYLRTLKDGAGNYLWALGLGTGRPNTINGYPYIEMPDLENKGAGKYPVIFGDFARGYAIVDDVVMGFIRDPYSLAGEGKVKFVSYRKVGGDVIMGEAIVKLKCSL